MDGLFFLMSIAAMGLMMHWLASNDNVPPDKPTHGLFKMKDIIAKARRRGGGKNQPFPVFRDAGQPQAARKD
jgi:hypothetical protein